MPTDTPGQPVPAADDLRNRVSALTIDEPSEEFLNAPDVERPAKLPDDCAAYESESLISLEDAIFALEILFDDMSRIRSHITWIWSQYKIGVFDLAAVAITTNTAIELVRSMIEDMLPLFKTFGSLGEMLHYFFEVTDSITSQGTDVIADSGDMDPVEIYDASNLKHLAIYTWIESFAAAIDCNKVPWFLDEPRDPTTNKSPSTWEEKCDEEHALLMPCLTHLMAVVEICGNTFYLQDEFIRGLVELDKSKEIPLYLVFAA
jgi:hypothetical protein